MTVRYIALLVAFFGYCLVFAQGHEEQHSNERQLEVGMRMIGHQVLLAVGDSSSRVLPIAKEGDQYTIRFGTEFGFDPDKITTTIDSVMRVTKLSENYIVEVITCDSCLVVHGYTKTAIIDAGMIPCKGRVQPVSCYALLITILDAERSTVEATSDLDVFDGIEHGGISYRSVVPWALMFLGLIGVVTVVVNRRSVPSNDVNTIRIGEFQFNKRNMELSINKERIKLTSKEADLLQLLSASANTTVERDDILASVWGDEGDYVGRTLDVFISKLRKKLEADANVQIVNIRGVGYKLVMGV